MSHAPGKSTQADLKDSLIEPPGFSRGGRKVQQKDQQKAQQKLDQKVPFWKSFGRAQVSSLIASGSDMAVLFGLVELFNVWYVLATALGAFMGAVGNFLLGRYWSFEAQDRPPQGQAFRYALVSAGSLLLNAGGVYAVTEWGGLKYGYSKLVVSLLIGFFFNFPLQRHYVFK